MRANPFSPGDTVFIPSAAQVGMPTNQQIRDRGLTGIVTDVWGNDTTVKWSNGTKSTLLNEYLALAPKEAPVAVATATVQVELKLNTESTVEQIESFRDRLVYAGFTKKQANKIATKAFTLASIKEA